MTLAKILGLSVSIFFLWCTAGEANAAKMDVDQSSIFLDKSGKQITPAEAYRSDDNIYECVKKEVHFNKRTGKPTLKKAD